MRIKQILVAFLFTALVISCGNSVGTDAKSSKKKSTTKTTKDDAKKEICSLYKTSIQMQNEIIELVNKFESIPYLIEQEPGESDAKKNYFNSLPSSINLERLDNNIVEEILLCARKMDNLENLTDKYFEDREDSVMSSEESTKILQSCPSYKEPSAKFYDDMTKFTKIARFLKNR